MQLGSARYDGAGVSEPMSNEALAALARDGNADALCQLYEQNRGLLAIMFRRLAVRWATRMQAQGVAWEDVEQCFFLAIADAVQIYDPSRGKFSSLLEYPVKKVFFELVGFRTERQRRDPLGLCASLDEPVTQEDGGQISRLNLIPDPHAGQAFTSAEERIYIEQLHDALEAGLNTLPPKQAQTIRLHYWEGLTLAQIGERLGCVGSYAQQLERAGLRTLGTGKASYKLAGFRHDRIRDAKAYHGTGYNAWKSGGSVQERTLVYLEEKGL